MDKNEDCKHLANLPVAKALLVPTGYDAEQNVEPCWIHQYREIFENPTWVLILSVV